MSPTRYSRSHSNVFMNESNASVCAAFVPKWMSEIKTERYFFIDNYATLAYNRQCNERSVSSVK
jgi:hypothetical protein